MILRMRSAVASAMNRSSTQAVAPWYIWCASIAVTLDILGFHWDISWHRSIGRDSFWTPAHFAIHLCAVLAGVTCAVLTCRTTFNHDDPLRPASVTVLGLRGPLGAFIMAWGGVAMLTSAPFDNWWHNAYGIDVKVFSIPHLMLASGMVAIAFGSLILTWTELNRATGVSRQRLQTFFIYLSGLLVGASTTPGNALLVFASEDSFTVLMHSAVFYRTLALEVPFLLAAVYRVLSSTNADGTQNPRYFTTRIAAVYTLVWFGFDWILPLFPAQPKLGPIYRPAGHFLPIDFPLLIIVPAIALDWLWSRLARYSDWFQASMAGTVFLLLIVAVQWPFANFLLSPGAQNWIFGGNQISPFLPPDSYTARRLFLPWEPSQQSFWLGMVIALFSSILTTRLGLACGNWMRELKR